MKVLAVLVLAALSSPSFGFESVQEFWEKFRTKSCEQSRDKATARIEAQKSDVYDGPIAAFHGRTIVRFVRSVQRCDVVYSEDEGMLYDYLLRVEVR